MNHLVASETFTAKHGNELRASLRSAFAPFNLDTALAHAELVEQNLRVPNADAFAQWLASAFQDFKVKPGREATLDAIRDLQQAGALLLTTNYDSLLSDATGLPPVTWEERGEFLKIVNRQRLGVLHLHGHWKRPTSVVLGKASYNRILGDPEAQTLFRSLWLQWSWIFIGCGDGLGDPNLGHLLHWGGRTFGEDSCRDYFLAKTDLATALSARPDKPSNLVCIGYPDHSDLAGILQALRPAARCRPFLPVDDNFDFFRAPASAPTVPFPSRQEYLDGEVPAFSADAIVQERLKQHGWAFVLDVASVGKTTLALRMVTSVEQRDHPVYYLDFAKVAKDDPDAEVIAALARLARPLTLLILDN